MATAPLLEVLPAETTGTDIVAVVSKNPGIVLLDHEKYSVWYDSLKARGDALPADVSTKKNRDALRSFAAEVRSEKAGIKKARLRMTEEWRTMTAQANAANKEIDEQLEGLAIEVRKPLTEWEAAEEARQVRVEGAICEIREMGRVSIDDTAASVRERGSAVHGMTFDPTEFGDRLDEAEASKATAIDALKTELARLIKAEADRAELEKLRAAQAERDAQDAAEREAREMNEAKRHRAKQIIAYIKNEVGMGTIGGKAYPYIILIRELEEKIIISDDEFGDMAGDVEQARRETLGRVLNAQKEQAERSQKEAEEVAAQAAREEAEKLAQADRDRIQREHDAEIAAERAKAVEADRLRQVEADRIAEVERQREAKEAADRKEAQRLADEQAKREANQRHVSSVMRAAKEAIMGCGCDEPTAKTIVVAIKGGMIPNVTLRF